MVTLDKDKTGRHSRKPQVTNVQFHEHHSLFSAKILEKLVNLTNMI